MHTTHAATTRPEGHTPGPAHPTPASLLAALLPLWLEVEAGDRPARTLTHLVPPHAEWTLRIPRRTPPRRWRIRSATCQQTTRDTAWATVVLADGDPANPRATRALSVKVHRDPSGTWQAVDIRGPEDAHHLRPSDIPDADEDRTKTLPDAATPRP